MNILTIPASYGISKPISGGQNRYSNMLKELKKRGGRIIVLEDRKLMGSEDQKIAKIYTFKDYRCFNRVFYIFRDINIRFALNIINILKREHIDLIELTQPCGMLITKLILKSTQNKILLVYSSHNVESDLVMDTFIVNPKYSELEKLILPIYINFLEKIICNHIADHIVVVSNEDKNRFIKKYGVDKEKVTVISSGARIANVRSKDCNEDIKEEMKIDPNKIIIFFHGLFSHSPNVDAFEIIENYIAPKFEEMGEKVLFVVGGTGVPKFERANFKSVGFIDELYKLMSIVDIAIVPLTRGAGTKLKVMDYLSVGLPIVTTKKGIEGINAKNGEHAIIVDDVNKEFIDAIKYLIDNEQERKRIGANARRLAEEEYDWDKIGEKLDGLYRKILMEAHK